MVPAGLTRVMQRRQSVATVMLSKCRHIRKNERKSGDTFQSDRGREEKDGWMDG
jgi:hypothetical protein